mmetsp:Transcript_47891/g.104184  ORF Transcript_47891/g.104184 Transcript_47891/m.104184 type:complete len:172 (-) Transcript_47891:300-815(-)
MTGRLAVAVTGALLVQLPLLLLQLSAAPSGAAWGWATSPPYCSFAGGSCSEGDTVQAGTTCTPQCSDANQVPSSSELACPADTDDTAWRGRCGFGSSCANPNLELVGATCGSGESSTAASSSTATTTAASSSSATAAVSSSAAATTEATASGATTVQSGMALVAVLAASMF